MQNHRHPETEAIIVAADNMASHIYVVDQECPVSCYDDVGFAAIGLGAWHAKSQLMRVGYTNSWNFTPALAIIYAAKKQGEIAPGVEKETDLFITTKHSCMPVLTELKEAIKTLYDEYETERIKLADRQLTKLNNHRENTEGDATRITACIGRRY